MDIAWVQLFSLACAKAPSRTEAEEHARGVFSALFIRMAAGKPTAVRADGTFKPLLFYMFRMLLNGIRSGHRRAEVRREVPLQAECERGEEIDDTFDLTAALARMEVGQPKALEARLAICTPREESVLSLWSIYRVSIEECADILGISVPAARKALRRGLRRIREGAGSAATPLGVHDHEQP